MKVMIDKILREPEVCEMTGMSRTSIWRLEKSGSFPRRVKLGKGRMVGWRLSEIQGWIKDELHAA